MKSRPGEDLIFEDDLTEKDIAEPDSSQLKKVVEGINDFFEESKDSISTTFETSAKTSEKREELRQRMGDDVFDFYYNYLLEKRQDPSTDEAKLRS